MKHTRTLFSSLLAVTSLVAQGAHGQPAPRACAATQPATVATGGAIQGVSVAAGSSDALWVLYDTAVGARRTVSLLSLTGVSSGQIAVNTFPVGEGSVGRSSLVVLGGNLVGAYKRTDGRVGVFSRPLSGGAITETQADASLTAGSAPVLAVVGRRAVVAWRGTGSTAYQLTVDAQGAAQGAARTLSATHPSLSVVGVFNGLTLGVSDSASGARLESLAARGPRAVGAVRNAGVRAFSASVVGRNALVLTIAGDTARVAFVRSAAGAGREHSIGPALNSAHAAIATTPWGAFALWPSAGTLSLRGVHQNGTVLGTTMAMVPFRATAPDAFSAVALGNAVYAFWGEGGNVQMLRINCYNG